MLSHGGAGVLHSTLRAGIPAIIAPLMGDQFFHAKLIHARELGNPTKSDKHVATWVVFHHPWGTMFLFLSPLRFNSSDGFFG